MSTCQIVINNLRIREGVEKSLCIQVVIKGLKRCKVQTRLWTICRNYIDGDGDGIFHAKGWHMLSDEVMI